MSGENHKTFTNVFSDEFSNILEKACRIFSRSFQPLYPLIVKQVGEGIVTDVNENVYVDFTSGGGCLLLGGSHPRIFEVISRLLEEKRFFTFQKSYNREFIEFAESLLRISPIRGEGRVLMLDSRSEAVETAVRVARLYTCRRMIVGFTGSYHGLTLGAQSISTDTATKWRRFEEASGFIRLPYPDCSKCFLKHEKSKCEINCFNHLEDMLAQGILDNTGAIIMQPLRSDGTSPPEEYLKNLKKLCKQNKILLIIDESLSAPARTGRWYILDYYDIDADIVILGSQISQGHPLGLLVSRSRLLDLEPNYIDPEIGGNMLTITIASTVLETLKDEGLIERAERIGRSVKKKIEELAGELKFITRVNGRGLYVGFELVEKDRPSRILARELVNECFRSGLLLRLERESVVVLSPPLNIGEEFLEKGLEILEAKLRELYKAKERL